MRLLVLSFCLLAVVYSSPTRRDTVALWDACNYPAMGINGPLQCAPGSECICKDDSKLSRMRTRCAMLTVSRLAAYSQCREQIGGVWSDNASWQCQKPGDTSTGSLYSSSSNSHTSSKFSSASQSSALGNSGEAGIGQNQVASSRPSSSAAVPQIPPPSPSAMTSPSTGSMDTSSGIAPDLFANASASVGGCSGLGVPGGWDGIASTSVYHLRRSFQRFGLTPVQYYGYMGTSCMCGAGNFGQASWQAVCMAYAPAIILHTVPQAEFSSQQIRVPALAP